MLKILNRSLHIAVVEIGDLLFHILCIDRVQYQKIKIVTFPQIFINPMNKIGLGAINNYRLQLIAVQIIDCLFADIFFL